MCGGVVLFKRIMAVLLLLFLYIPKVRAEVSVSAKSAICLHYPTGQVLYAKNADEKLPMASTTKIMTALVALENAKLSDMVTVGENAAGVEGSTMYLKKGEKLSMSDLLHGLMLSSGNDAAVAIAEHVAGSEEAFCELMNQKAESLGCSNTQFQNANGLPDEAHFTTALELARITGEALKNETFRNIVSQKSAKVSGKLLTNHNKMLSLYEGAIGVKTGYTKKAGRTLVSAARRDDIELIAVTLNAPDDWEDHKKMLNAGFDALDVKILAEKSAQCGELPVMDGEETVVPIQFAESFSIPVSEGKIAAWKLVSEEILEAPIKQGEGVGKAVFYLDDIPMGEVNVIAGKDILRVNKPSFFDLFIFAFKKWGGLFS